MHTIDNGTLRIEVDEKGAELKSVRHQQHGLDYLWSGDPAIWGKTSPVLFPIVGALKDNTYLYNEQAYTLSRHGFARDRVFAVTKAERGAVTFVLESDAESLQVYPFPFRFSIRYALQGDTLSVTYRVENTGEDVLYFSVGGHPAFSVPLVEGTRYEDYRLVFGQAEEAGRWPISPEGLIMKEPLPLLEGKAELPLTKELFSKDALVFKDLQSDRVQLVSDKTPHGLQFHFPGFPNLGLWAAPGADFVCIEPWYGIADSVDASGELTTKEGIVSLPPGDQFEATWSVQFF